MIAKISARYVFFFLFVFKFFSAHTQITHLGEPLLHPTIDTLFVPVIDLELTRQATKVDDKSELNFKVDEFAIPVKVSINASDFGVWVDYKSQNKKVWLIRIKSKNANSLNIIFDAYKLVPGVKVFLYNKEQKQILGALDYRNNKSWNSLATSPIKGDEVYIELQVPMFIDNYGEFNIGQVGIEKQQGNLLKSTQDRWFNHSASCHVNVNCYQSPEIQRQKRAVCRIIYRGTSRCTGTLINNLDNNRTPYVLTAAHCFTTDFIAKDAVFDFNYESPTCENIDDTVQSISGATVISNVKGLDFVLLRLSENIPLKYDSYYSGWDARGIPPQSSFALHHPEGDIQKISIDEDEATIGSFPGMEENKHWVIFDYEIGTSEVGSSGCGLVSNENYLIGTLTGGGDTCSPTISDRYQKFDNSFNDYPAPENQLKAWLDPSGKNKLTCKGDDVTGKIRNSAQVLTNILDEDNLESIKQKDSWGYLAGHNYQGNTLFAEYFQLNGSKYLYGANIELAKLYFDTLKQGEVVFSIWEGGEVPGKLIYELPLPYIEINLEKNEKKIKLEFDSTLLVHNNFYFGYRISYATDSFAVKTASTETTINSAFTYLNHKWVPLQLDNHSYASKLDLEVLVFDFLPDKEELPDTNLFSNVNIYPNPSNNQFQVFFKEGVHDKVVIKIFDLSGRPVYIKEWLNPDSNIPVKHNLPRGVYILNVTENDKRIYARKVLVL